MGRYLWGWGRLPKLDWCAGSGQDPLQSPPRHHMERESAVSEPKLAVCGGVIGPLLASLRGETLPRAPQPCARAVRESPKIAVFPRQGAPSARRTSSSGRIASNGPASGPGCESRETNWIGKLESKDPCLAANRTRHASMAELLLLTLAVSYILAAIRHPKAVWRASAPGIPHQRGGRAQSRSPHLPSIGTVTVDGVQQLSLRNDWLMTRALTGHLTGVEKGSRLHHGRVRRGSFRLLLFRGLFLFFFASRL